ncbi:MAG: hypothetical protein K1X89_31660, partial [Myxococcaceae bacterium]|nr:hypothetical protein [Myxococcaceae bacterium]
VVWPGAALPAGPLGLPSPVALAAALVLERLGASEAEVVALVPASSAGRAGLEQLERQTASLLNAKEPSVSVFPHRLAFNLIPEVAGEARAQAELNAKLPGCAARVTAVQTPHFHGLMLVVTARLSSPASPVEVRARFQGASGLKLVDDVPQHVYPMPMLAVSDASVLVGRLEVEGPRVRLVAAVDPLVQLGQAAARLAVSLAGA